MNKLMKQFANFDEFVTTKILKAAYLAGTVLIGLGMLAGLFGGMAGCVTALRYDSASGALGSLFFAVLYLIGGLLGIVLWRVYCEILIVIFKMNENLQALRDSKG